MTRIMTPTPTRGNAPSHSPPDVRYAPGLGMARALGWFSIGLGLAELLAPHTMAELTGVHRPRLLQAFGLREIVSGIGILSSDQPAGWMWSRVVGDGMDLATLAQAQFAANGDGTQRQRARAATAAVAGVAALDVLCSLQLSAAAALEG